MVQRAWEGRDKNFILHSPVTFRIAIIWPERGVSKKLKKINVPFYLMHFCLVVHSLCIAPSTDSWHGRNTFKCNLKTALEVRTTHFGKKGQKTLYVEKRYETTTMLSKLCKKWPQTLQKMASTAHPFSLVSLRVEPNKFGLEGFRPSKVLMINGLIPFS